LDDAKIYQERLEVMLHRLELRSELYKQPERAEDLAGMIIEQVTITKCDSRKPPQQELTQILAPCYFLLHSFLWPQ